jgi:glycerol-3-phosphate dehydrogenase
LPAVHEGSDELADRAVLLDHKQQGGPRGLFSVSGVKFTTARRVAEKTMSRLFPDSPAPIAFDHRTLDEAIGASMKRSILNRNGGRPGENAGIQLQTLENIMRSESVVHLHDLVFRRTNLWEDPELALKISAEVGQVLKMDQGHLTEEMQLIKRYLESEMLF